MSWNLKTPTRFSLDAVVNSHGWSQLEPFRKGETSGLACVMELPAGEAVEVVVDQHRRDLSVTARPPLGAKEKSFVESRLSWMLGLDQDLGPFYDAVTDDPRLAHVRERQLGRLLRSPSLFEDVVKTILTTNTTWSGTLRMVSRLVESRGLPVAGDADRKAFPSPERVASAGIDVLREEVGLGYRAPYIHEIASDVVSGALDLESFKKSDLPTVSLRKELLRLKGVGPYAAATLLMLLGRYDFLPVDSWSSKLVSHEWHDGDEVGREDIEAAFERWGPWKALIYWFWDWELLKLRDL